MAGIALSWEQAGVLTLALAAASIAIGTRGERARRFAAFGREAAIISALYTLWQFAGELSVLGTQDAFHRADWIERTERAWHLPSEASVQRLLTSNSWTAQTANIYYATMHFGVLFVFLFWLFARHRDRYRQVRRVLALTTFLCLLIQLVPVAPPRLLPGYKDIAAEYGQSVYGFGFDADQLSAMPSVHVAWAVLVGWAVWRIGSGSWRVLGPIHAVLTILVVVATANHFWADGVVAVAVLGLSAVAERSIRRIGVRLRSPAPDTATPRYELKAASNSDILP